jgi:hypothetical protein
MSSDRSRAGRPSTAVCAVSQDDVQTAVARLARHDVNIVN